MTTAQNDTAMAVVLKKEIMLQINQRLYDTGVISRDLYEQAKKTIISDT